MNGKVTRSTPRGDVVLTGPVDAIAYVLECMFALSECETSIQAIQSASRSRLEHRLQAINTVVQTATLVQS